MLLVIRVLYVIPDRGIVGEIGRHPLVQRVFAKIVFDELGKYGLGGNPTVIPEFQFSVIVYDFRFAPA